MSCNKYKWTLVLIIFLLVPFVQAIPEVELTYEVTDQTITVNYRLSSDIGCEKFKLYHNDVEKDIYVGFNCDASGTETYARENTNEFHALIGYVDGTYETIITEPHIISGVDLEAPTASNLEFLRFGNPMSAISSSGMFIVDVEFEINDESLKSVSADLSGMTINPSKQAMYSNIEVHIEQCAKGEGIFTCKLSNMELEPEGTVIEIILELEDESGNTNTVTLSKTLAISNDDPEVVFMGTNNCDDTNCYVKTGLNNIILEFSGSAGFDSRQIFYSTGGQIGRASSCSNSECSGLLDVSCNDGPTNLYLALSGGSASQDDAGNTVGGITSTQVMCDNTAPVITNFNIASSSGLDFFKFGDELVVTVNVTELSEPKIILNLEDFDLEEVTGQCVKTESHWECVASVTMPPKEDAYSGIMNVTIIDLVGNKVSVAEEIEVLSIETGGVPDLWTLGSKQYSPNVFNKAFLSNSDNNIYYNLRLKSKQKGAQTVAIVPGKCIAVEGYGRDGLVKSIELLTKQKGATDIVLNLKLLKTKNYPYDEIKFNCELQVYSTWGDIFYEQPEIVKYPLNIRIVSTDDVGGAIEKELEDSRNRVEDLEKVFSDLRYGVNKMRPLCESLGLINGVESSVTAASAATEPIPPLKPTSVALEKASKTIGSVKKNLWGSKFFGQACRMITCDPKSAEGVGKIFASAPGMGTLSNIAGYAGTEPEQMVDPYKSIVVALYSKCIPAVIDHVDRYTAIECEYQRCISQDVRAGYPISECMSTKSYATCKFTIGQVAETIPYTAMQRRIGEKVTQILSNPASLGSLAASYFLCDKVEGGIMLWACKLPANIGEIKTFADMMRRWPDKIEPTTYCEDVASSLDDNGMWKPYNYKEELGTDRRYDVDEDGNPTEAEADAKEWDVSRTEIGGSYFTSEDEANVNLKYLGIDPETGKDMYGIWHDRDYLGAYAIEDTMEFNPGANNPIDIPDFLFDLMKDTELTDLQISQLVGSVNRLKKVEDEAHKSVKTQYTSEGSLKKFFGENTGEVMELYKDVELYQNGIDQSKKSLAIANQDINDREFDLRDTQREIDSYNEEIARINFGEPSDIDIEYAQLRITELTEEQKINEDKIDQLKDIVKDINKDSEGYKNDLDETNVKITDEFKEAQEILKYNTARNTGWKLWSHMLEDAMAVDYLTQKIPGYSNLPFVKGWSNFFKGIFEKDAVQVAFGDYEGYFCENKLIKSSQEGQALISSGATFFRSAVHVEGEQSPLITSYEGDRYYNYFVSYGVNAKEGGLKFAIYVDGVKITDTLELPEDNPSISNYEEVLSFNSSTIHSKVCVKFEQSGSELYNYFDNIEFNNNQICNKIKKQ